jgi:glutamate-1-semialdehyde aminotransferase
MERIVLSTAHTQEDIERTLAAAEDILRKLPK